MFSNLENMALMVLFFEFNFKDRRESALRIIKFRGELRSITHESMCVMATKIMLE